MQGEQGLVQGPVHQSLADRDRDRQSWAEELSVQKYLNIERVHKRATSTRVIQEKGAALTLV